MPVTRATKSVKLDSVLWADDKSKPYKNKFGGRPWRWCASSPRSEKPKTAIMVTHLDKNGFTGSFMPTDFFCLKGPPLDQPKPCLALLSRRFVSK